MGNIKKKNLKLKSLLKILICFIITVIILLLPIIIRLYSISPHEIYKKVYKIDMNVYNKYYYISGLDGYIDLNKYKITGNIDVIKEGIFNNYGEKYILNLYKIDDLDVNEILNKNKNKSYFFISNKEIIYADKYRIIKTDIKNVYKYPKIDMDYRYLFDIIVQSNGYNEFIVSVILRIMPNVIFLNFVSVIVFFLLTIFFNKNIKLNRLEKLKMVNIYLLFSASIGGVVSFFKFDIYIIVYLLLTLIIILGIGLLSRDKRKIEYNGKIIKIE